MFIDKNGDLLGCGNNADGRLVFGVEEEVLKHPTFIKTPERIKKVFASNFSAIITESDDLYIWGEFLGNMLEMTNFFLLDDEMRS